MTKQNYKKKGKVTLKDIADIAGVTSMTVSRVVSGKGRVKEETRQRILKLVKDLDYTPNLLARSLSSMKSMTIGIIIPKAEQVFLDNYLAQILSGIMAVVKENDYKLLIYPVDTIEDKGNPYLSVAHSKLVDGIILLKPKKNDPYLFSLTKSGFPYILINHHDNDIQYNFIDTDLYNASASVVNHLHERGCRKIGFITGNMEEQNSLDQLEGYKKGLSDVGLNYAEELVINAQGNAGKAYTDLNSWIQNRRIPDAIIGATDYIAIAVMDRLKAEGISVPDNVAVVGCNDIDLAKFTQPTLTTIKQPLLGIGKVAAENLIGLIETNLDTPVQISLDVQLIIRESS